jgi:hypothetical protein
MKARHDHDLKRAVLRERCLDCLAAGFTASAIARCLGWDRRRLAQFLA